MLADEMNRPCSGLIATIASYIDARKPPTDNFFSFSLALPEAHSPSTRNNKALRFIEDPDESIVALSNHNHYIWKMFVACTSKVFSASLLMCIQENEAKTRPAHSIYCICAMLNIGRKVM